MADQAVEAAALDEREAQQQQHEEQQEQQPRALRFACKKCRCALFSSEELMPHEPERHQISTRRVRSRASSLAADRAVG